VILGTVDDAIDKYIGNFEFVTRTRDVLPARYAWEGNILYQAASTEQKASFLDRCLDEIERLGQSDGSPRSLSADCRPLSMDINNLQPPVLAWQHYLAMHHVFNLSDPLSQLPDSTRARLAEMKDKATSTIRTYLHDVFTSLSPTPKPPLSTVIEIYNSYASSKPATSTERCGICGDSVLAKHATVGSCSNNHHFQRCSITMLTLSTPFVFTCRVCKSKMIDKRAFEEDEEWCELVCPGEKIKVSEIPWPEANRCIYCGGEWFRSL